MAPPSRIMVFNAALGTWGKSCHEHTFFPVKLLTDPMVCRASAITSKFDLHVFSKEVTMPVHDK